MIHPMNNIVTISPFLLGGICSQSSSSTARGKENRFVSSAYPQTAREIYNSGATMRQVWMGEKDEAELRVRAVNSIGLPDIISQAAIEYTP